MSKWAAFLSDIQSSKEVTLIGPLYGQRHTPLMPTVYVDGGCRFHPGGGWAHPGTPGVFPIVSVGDGDSAAGSLDELLPADKDYSDLAFVLRSLPAAVEQVYLLGFTGGRRDHELANLGEVAAFLNARPGFARADLPAASGERIVGFAHGTLELQIVGTFSVFVSEGAAVRIEGAAKFPLAQDTWLQPFSSHGLSNSGLGNVRVSCAKACFVILN